MPVARLPSWIRAPRASSRSRRPNASRAGWTVAALGTKTPERNTGESQRARAALASCASTVTPSTAPAPVPPSCAGAVETTSSPPLRYHASTPSASHQAPIASTVSRAAARPRPAPAASAARRPCRSRSRRCGRSARGRSGRPRARRRARPARPRARARRSRARCSRRRPRRRRPARSPSSGGSTSGLPASAIQYPCASCSIRRRTHALRRGDRRALDVAQPDRHVDADGVASGSSARRPRAPRGSPGSRAAGAAASSRPRARPPAARRTARRRSRRRGRRARGSPAR